jgi:hypothetical protein
MRQIEAVDKEIAIAMAIGFVVALVLAMTGVYFILYAHY